MEQVPKEVATGLLARLRNPVLASFLISWSIYNWKAFVYLLSGAPDAKARIGQVTAEIATTESWLLPLLFAVGYTVVAQWIWLLVSLYADLANGVRERKNAAIRRSRLQVEGELTATELELTRTRRSVQEFKDEETKLKERVATVFTQLRDDLNSRIKSEQDLAKSNFENATQKLRLDIETLMTEANGLLAGIQQQQTALQENASTIRGWMQSTASERAELLNDALLDARRNLEEFNTTLLERQRMAAEAFNDEFDALVTNLARDAPSIEKDSAKSSDG